MEQSFSVIQPVIFQQYRKKFRPDAGNGFGRIAKQYIEDLPVRQPAVITDKTTLGTGVSDQLFPVTPVDKPA